MDAVTRIGSGPTPLEQPLGPAVERRSSQEGLPSQRVADRRGGGGTYRASSRVLPGAPMTTIRSRSPPESLSSPAVPRTRIFCSSPSIPSDAGRSYGQENPSSAISSKLSAQSATRCPWLFRIEGRGESKDPKGDAKSGACLKTVDKVPLTDVLSKGAAPALAGDVSGRDGSRRRPQPDRPRRSRYPGGAPTHCPHRCGFSRRGESIALSAMSPTICRGRGLRRGSASSG